MRSRLKSYPDFGISIVAVFSLVLAGGCDEEPEVSSTSVPNVEVCRIGPGELPSLTLMHYDRVVQPGSDLRIDCGPQGTFMIAVLPDLRGFTADDEWVDLGVRMEVPGADIGSGETFYEDSAWPHYVGCDDDVPNFVPILVPNGVSDIEALHGLDGTLSISAEVADGTIEVWFPVLLHARNEGDHFFCYG